MKVLIEEYGRALIAFVITAIFFGIIPSLMEQVGIGIESDRSVIVGDAQILDTLEKPTLVVVSSKIEYGVVFDYQDYIIEAKSASGIDLKDNVIFIGDVDTSTRGGVDVIYEVFDEYGLRTKVPCSFVVE